MTIELNPELDLEALANEFQAAQKLRVQNIFTTESAEYILDQLKNATPWHLVHSDKHGLPVKYNPQQLTAMSDAEFQGINNRLHERAASGYQYMYKFYPIIDAIQAGALSPSSMLYELANFVNGTEFIGFSRALTGAKNLVKVDPQASLYEPGHFLHMHDDSSDQRAANDTSSRRFAIVLGFTKDWSSNWGGQTCFYDRPDSVASQSWKPGFNVLTIFKVPVLHNVNYVSPFAATGRYSITGWLRDDPNIKRPDLGDT
ncbi:MAG: 2OG-Fe(II) oxygenase family protein [Pseudomonadota bacterium]